MERKSIKPPIILNRRAGATSALIGGAGTLVLCAALGVGWGTVLFATGGMSVICGILGLIER